MQPNALQTVKGDILDPDTLEAAVQQQVAVISSLGTKKISLEAVILDNATFDHGGRIAQLIESVGCHLLYLPPYSPDLNRIEGNQIDGGLKFD